MTRGTGPRFASVVLDVDSTVSAIEGIDWLADRRGPAAGAHVAELTDRAMRGELPLDAVYGERLAVVRPTRDDVDALAAAYVECVEPDAAGAIRMLRRSGIHVCLVSGGLREAILPLGTMLGFAEADVHAVGVRFGPGGEYAGFDASSPLTTAQGKRTLVASLGLPSPALAVGDGATDLAIRPVVAAFAAFTGFVRRDAIVAAADYEVASFSRLLELVLQ